MKKILRRINFFYKLFIAFLFTGIIPIVLISTVFAFLSGDIMKGSYRQQSRHAIERISDDLDEQLNKYRHTIYSMSFDEEIIASLQENKYPERSELLKLYQKLYKALTGNIDNVSLHIISLTDFPSLSTQQIPSFYLLGGDDVASDLFQQAEKDPQKTAWSFHHFVNPRGDRVMLTFCRLIRDSSGKLLGYVVLDVNKNPLFELCEKVNKDFFSQLYIVDPQKNHVSDFNRDDNDGNFSLLPFLSRIPVDLPGQYMEGDRMIVYHPLDLSPLQIAGSVPMKVILSNLAYLIKISLWMILFSVFLSVLLAFLVSRSISRPVHRLTLAMGKVEAGDLSMRIKSDRTDEIGLLFKRFNIMTERISNLMDETREEQEQLRVAERKALQAQINPHFLYNTLNTIKSIAKLEGIDKIAEIVTSLGKLLHNTIDSDSEIISLRENVSLIENYLGIQKMRYGDRLDFRIDVDESLHDLYLPKLIIQPIVENAVVHGLESKIGQGHVLLKAFVENGFLIIEISDNGKGMDKPWVPEKRQSGGGVGMINVHRRLSLLFGADAGLNVTSEKGKGTAVRIILPVLKEGRI